MTNFYITEIPEAENFCLKNIRHSNVQLNAFKYNLIC